MLLVYFKPCNAQNLVPNPSFEDLTSCPTYDSQIHLAYPWFSPYLCMGGTFESCSSSDLFNVCHVPNPPFISVGVPISDFGYQFARTGQGYAGIGFWYNSGIRERIEIALKEQLIKDKIYCLKMFVVNKKMQESVVSSTSTANLHFMLTNEILIDEPNNFVFGIPSVKNNDSLIIADTTNWMEVSGCYKALGGEKYLTIGSFYENANSSVSNATADWAYYFIDDVSVELYDGVNCDCPEINDTANIENPNHLMTLVNIFTPNGDGVNDNWLINVKSNEDFVVILNRWGNKIAYLDLSQPFWDGKVNGQNCPEGVYYYKAFINEEFKTGFIHLIR